MADDQLRTKVARTSWYHEFEFPNGIRTEASGNEAERAAHRRIWSFIEEGLEPVDFRGKSVLEIGCWDGYWSFFVERKGAKSVLATDDLTQNWSDGGGIHLAKDLLRSAVEIRQDLSIYDIASLQQTFDIIICFGVYYHLADPFYAFAQIRRCCHADTLVLLEGDVDMLLAGNEVRYPLEGAGTQFLPSPSTLVALLGAAYLQVKSARLLLHGEYRPAEGVVRRGSLGRKLLSLLTHWLPGAGRDSSLDRAFVTCTPFQGINKVHAYEPPFGLKAFDDRYCKQFKADIQVQRCPETLPEGSLVEARVVCSNVGEAGWRCAPNLDGSFVTFGVQIYSSDGRLLDDTRGRRALPVDVDAGEQVDVTTQISLNGLPPGDYRLRFDMVYEGVCWLQELRSPVAERWIEIMQGATP